jgi:lipoprotein-anchoring transpeptidase ErfK/SrfK
MGSRAGDRIQAVAGHKRYIYIHGCPEIEPMGIAASHDCIRMRNADIVELFDLVESGSSILIQE